MANQTAANIKVTIAPESTAGTAAVTSVTTARVLRITGSPGLELKRALIVSNEKRDDANKGKPRLGGKSVDGSYNAELTVGGAMTHLTEAILRAAYSTSTAIGFATMTTVAIGTSTLTANAGDWVGAQGLRVGDVFTLSSTTVSGNNNLRTMITAISSLTISVPLGTFTTLAATATGTLTRLRKLTQGTTPTAKSYTVEQYDEDNDLSELFLGCKCIGLGFSFRPGQMATVNSTWLGMDRTILTTGTSPWFTASTVTTGLSLVADDCQILKSGVAVTTFTGFEINFQITAAGQPVIGSFVSPAIFDNDLAVDGSVMGLLSDFTNLTTYDAETEFEIGIVLTELASAPKPCFAVYLPCVKIKSRAAPVGGDDGAKIETLGLAIMPRVAATGYDAGVATFHQSAE